MNQIRRKMAAVLVLLLLCTHLSGCKEPGAAAPDSGVKLTSYDKLNVGDSTDLTANVRVLQRGIKIKKDMEG